MKYKHLRNAMSVTLAVAMLSSTLVGNIANASVIVNDDTGTGSASVETDDSVTVDTSTDGIVTTDDGIEISTEQKHLISSVKVADDGIELEDDNGLKAGSKVKLSASAENKLSEAVKFKLYFWNYSENTSGENTEYPGMLNSVPEKLTVKPDVAAITDADGTEVEAKATFMQDKDGDAVTASYVLVELPANSKLSLDMDVSNETAGKVVAIPYLENTENSACGDSVCIDWEEDGIQVDTDINVMVDSATSSENADDGIITENDGIEVDDNDSSTIISDEDSSDSEAIFAVTDDAENSLGTDTVSKDMESETFDIYDNVKIDEDTGSINLDTLNDSDFYSQRLLVLTDDASVIRDNDTIDGQYGSLYLLSYDSVKATENAYVYYAEYALAVEPDSSFTAATEDGVTVESEVETDENAIATLSAMDVTPVQDMSKVIAVLDTGMNESANVINRVSLIDDNLSSTNNHGTQMRDAIVEQNSNAEVLSIRVMDDTGRGSVSSIVAGMEYAMEQGVGIINLSMSSRMTMLNKVLEAEINRASEKGIVVVAAAGNEGEDVVNYMPGSVESAYVVGACNSEGVRLITSNYGDTVDYNIVSNSTSEAAAKFSGYVSANGISNIDVNSGIVFSTSYRKNETAESEEKSLRVYYLLYDQDKPDPNEYTKAVMNTLNLYYKYEPSEDGSIYCKINPDPAKYDYNANGIDLDVDINRGGPTTDDDIRQIPITDECQYDESTGYIRIPAEYADKNLTVTVWVVRNSAFYADMVPDDKKPQSDRTGKMSVAYSGLAPSYNAHGCNENLILKGDISKISVGSQWYAHGTTRYIGFTGELPYSWVKGASAYYETTHGGGQIFNITSCKTVSGQDAPMFVNIGGAGNYGNSKTNWLWGGCISDVSNYFSGQPAVQSIYIECVAKTGNKCEFYFSADCSSPDGSANAQTMVSCFTAIIEPDKATLEVDKRFWCAPIAEASPRYGNLKATFTIYKDSKCTKVVDKLTVDGHGQSSGSGKIALDGGIYYVKETTRITGTVINEAIYGPIKISKGSNKNLKDYVPAKDRGLKSMDQYGRVINKPIFYTGLVLKKKDATKDIYLPNAVFKINYSENAEPFKTKRTWYFVTDSKGQIKYTNDYLADNNKKFKAKYKGKSSPLFSYSSDKNKTALPLCTLHIKEVEAPDGYARDNTMYTVHVMPTKATSGSEKWDYTVQNATLSKDLVIENKTVDKFWSIQVNLKKIDGDGKALAGAVFDIFDNEDCNGIPLGRLTSGSDGMSKTITIKDIPWDNETYTIWAKEVSAPKGFAKLEQPIKLEYKRSDFEKLFKTDPNTNGQLQTFGIDGVKNGKGVVNTDGWKVRIQTKKIKRNKEPLAGAKFGIFADEDYKEQLAEITSGANGMTDIATLLVPMDKKTVTYYCKETFAPEGKVLDPNAKATLTFTYEKYKELKDKGDASGELKIFGPKEGYINDDGWKVRVKAKKEDADGNPVPGAVFTIYDSEGCENEVGTITSGDDGWTEELTLTQLLSTKSVTYYAKETTIPEGYSGDSEKVYHVTFTYEDYKKLSEKEQKVGELKIFNDGKPIINTTVTITPTPTETPTPSPTPTPPTGAGVHVRKISTASDDIMALNGYTLAGAKFHIYGGEAGDGQRGDSRVDTYVTTDENGYSATVSLPDPSWWEYPTYTDSKGNEVQGTPIHHSVTTIYTIEEVVPPKGHSVAKPKSQTISVTMPYNKDTVFEQLFKDEPEFTNKTLQLDKVSSKGNPINGVVFKVEFFDTELEGVDYGWTGLGTNGLEDESKPVVMSDETDTGIATLEAEDDSMEVDTIDVQSLPDSDLVVMSSGGGTNSIKTDSEAKITDTGMSGTPTRTWYLQADEKGLVLLDENHLCRLPQYHSDPFYMHNKRIVIPLYGVLQVTEEKCPAEYIKCDEIIQFPTTKDGDLSARIYNDLEPCKVNIKKFKEDGKTAIAGVEFEIKFVKQSEGFTSKQREYKRLLKEGETVTRSTDWEGNCYFDQLDQGDYEITEIKTASGQTLLKDPIKFSIPFKMTEDEANEYQDINYESAREDTDYTNKWYFYECSYIITNTPVFDLPHTGATGTWTYGFVGLGIALAAGSCGAGAVLLGKRRRRRKLNK